MAEEHWHPTAASAFAPLRTLVVALLYPSMGDFIAYNSRWRVAGLILLSVAFVLLGLWLVGAFGPSPGSRRYPLPAPVKMGIGWLSMVFFGLCGIAWAKKFFDKQVQLTIGPLGVRWYPWSDHLIPWSEVHKVTTWSAVTRWGLARQRFIVLHLRNPEGFPGRGLTAMFAGANRKMTGGDICISLTGTNRSFDEAMSAIAHFRG